MEEPDEQLMRQRLARDAARKEALRERKTRDRLAKHIDVLDDLDVGIELPAKPTLADVAAFFHVHRARIAALRLSHRDELLSDGWQPEDPARPGRDIWSPQAVVRAALLLDAQWGDDALHLDRPGTKPSTVAAQIRYLLGRSPLPVVYSSSAGRIRQCATLHETAMRIAEHVHDEGAPSKLWAELQETERYELQALVVALAALVPIDQPDLTAWLKSLGHGGCEGSAVARGLVQLVPEPSLLYRRRALGKTRRQNMEERRAASGA